MITTNQLATLIGKSALLRCGELDVAVTVIDSRKVWARVDCLVEPVSGDGQQWVSCERLTEYQPENSTVLTATRAVATR